MDVQRIREYMRKWADYTYYQGVDFYKNKTDAEKETCLAVLKQQKLAEKKMDGYSIEKIPFKWEGALREISFSKTFCDAIEREYITPASYAMDITKECIRLRIASDKTVGIVGRGLRSFPAFLREIDLASKISETVVGCECRRANPDEDIVGHTDIVLNVNGETIKLWSYQDTSVRALNNTISKLKGERGQLNPGIYLLCPINYKDKEQYEDINGWRLYNWKYAEKIGYEIYGNDKFDYYQMQNQTEYALKKFICKIRMIEKH